jgi:hypothetical protein
MESKGIIFSGPMVRAILEGRKTMTRRLKFKCNVGDDLWVKESWRADHSYDHLKPSELLDKDWSFADYIVYEADCSHRNLEGKLRSSLFMPRRFSRITLRCTSYREEYLQDINDTENDIIREGATVSYGGSWSMDWESGDPKQKFLDPIAAFADYVCRVNHDDDFWFKDPMVHVIGFEVVK